MPRTDTLKPERATAPRITLVEERAARQVICDYRGKLAWMMTVPQWEDLLERGVEVLELPGARKGIGLKAALNALLIENKYALLRWTVEHFNRQLASAVGLKLDRLFGLDLLSEQDLDGSLSNQQWTRLREQILFRLGQEHRRYKRAQRLLYCGYEHLVEIAVHQIVFQPSHRPDCLQEGAIALLHAIDKVNGQDNLKVYALIWIKRSIRNFLMGERLPVHVPVNLISRSSAAVRAEAAPVQEKNLALILECLRQPSISLNETQREEVHGLLETLADDTAECPARRADKLDLVNMVHHLVAELTDKQREVLRRRFGLDASGFGQTLAEIARSIGISHQQVSMREKRALQNLEAGLAPFLGELHGR